MTDIGNNGGGEEEEEEELFYNVEFNIAFFTHIYCVHLLEFKNKKAGWQLSSAVWRNILALKVATNFEITLSH